MFNEAVLKILQNNKEKLSSQILMYCHIISRKNKGNYFEYSLTILDSNRQPDKTYPIIPCVKDNISYEAGDIVVIAMMYNNISDVQILKKVVL